MMARTSRFELVVAVLCTTMGVHAYAGTTETIILNDVAQTASGCVTTLRPVTTDGLPASFVISSRTNVDPAFPLDPSAGGTEGALNVGASGTGTLTSACEGSGLINGFGTGQDEELIFRLDRVVRAGGATLRLGGVNFATDSPVLFVSSATSAGFDYTITESELQAAFVAIDSDSGDVVFANLASLPADLAIDAFSVRETTGEVSVEQLTVVNPKADLDHGKNGSAGSPQAVVFEDGNAGSSNSHYVEGYSVPYRVVMTDLPTATSITLVIEYDIIHSDKHAIDYITNFDRLEPHAPFGHAAETVDPTEASSPSGGCAGGVCAGISGPADSTFAIPAPSSTSPCASPVTGEPTADFNALPAGERVMSMWNGTITGLAYVSEGCLTDSPTASTSIGITFTTTDSTAILAWGGHIGTATVWGAGNSAGGISGSPYHTRLVSWTLSPAPGQQDHQLAAGAVVNPCDSLTCGDSTCSPECGEDCNTCAADCHTCGDGCCDVAAGEDCTNCAADCHTCGDGCCDAAAGENCTNCAADCHTCGDGCCDAAAGENKCNCPQDCLPDFCGDGCCTGTEDCTNCAADCHTCGDGCCDAAAGENCTNCALDCHTCGDGCCDPGAGEDRCTCPQDCLMDICGDGCCTGAEDCNNCATDCVGCGDGCCDVAGGEDCINCAIDCVSCGDGCCDVAAGEDCNNCAVDCAGCGDGCCDPGAGENCTNCPADCHTCGDGCCDGAVGEDRCTCPQDCLTDVCGDGCCTGIETCANCAVDCHFCGDGCCDPAAGEDCTNCSVDCHTCGDGCCDPAAGENCTTCAIDCVACGDGCCDAAAGETCVNCAADCHTCGDGCCDASVGEDRCTCPQDCLMDVCGDGCCTGMETCASCAQDCHTCGDGCCDAAAGETCVNCAIDCHTCGDGCCNAAVGENCHTCLTDCPPTCGDGVCECGENCSTCPSECLCNDGKLCTTDTCNAGVCVFTPIDCSDGNACTSDLCNPTDGSCINVPNPTIICDDGDACTVDSCVPADGTCVNVPDPAINCDDGDACNIDFCNSSDGSCGHVVSVTCDDSNACTSDNCNPTTGSCVFVVTTTCNDSNACTTDSCDPTDASCSNVVNKTCNDNSACTTDSCNPASGTCVFSPTVTCNDGDVCTNDACDPATGTCVFVANALCGACCLPDGGCLDDVSRAECVAAGGEFRQQQECLGDNDGDGREDLCRASAPAVSEWGMAAVLLLLLVGVAIKFGCRVRRAV